MNYKLLKHQIESQGFNLNQIAKKLNVSRTGLWQSIERETLTVQTLEEISKILKVDPRLFIDKTDIHPEALPLPEVQELKDKYVKVLEENHELRQKH
ncbi:helix-turn-helix domain-containing protein [Croceimicrobium hydrocarbonivorans]|uniref:Helix-turn-helix transcriptional regulator n=1 Tax=Croceimicrobium hydrocarbonivorans TaxID=2761580 RepID=A0A7H0VB80_9FLAO|nr:helix-turn-helix transcriptional regulator [Croceimicrobium hydrocarbonivorans]QNR22935.1 helix-turn-helix transcriptional regulator [Croceimicrobium hydrocarbonivorans]QNR22978.1 helix-turn-helix transcriptional regulator [Croceimicrobium hydrocarbonivorans]